MYMRNGQIHLKKGLARHSNSLAAKSKNVTFDGKICYKLPSMLNHIFMRWAIWYGWMAGFLLSFKVFLGQKMQKMN